MGAVEKRLNMDIILGNTILISAKETCLKSALTARQIIRYKVGYTVLSRHNRKILQQLGPL